jgi:hypothetical protein
VMGVKAISFKDFGNYHLLALGRRESNLGTIWEHPTQFTAPLPCPILTPIIMPLGTRFKALRPPGLTHPAMVPALLTRFL